MSTLVLPGVNPSLDKIISLVWSVLLKFFIFNGAPFQAQFGLPGF
jgi:hypothetical protein